MGNWHSLPVAMEHEPDDIWWSYCRTDTESDLLRKRTVRQNVGRSLHDHEFNFPREISEEHKQELNEFKLELERKHEKRRNIINSKKLEMENLRKELELTRRENQHLKEASAKLIKDEFNGKDNEMERLRQQNEELKNILNEKSKLLENSTSILQNNRELKLSISEMQNEIQRLNTEVDNFDKERKEHKTHVIALKDVITVSKHMLQIREAQLKELKQKIESIEELLEGTKMNVLQHNLRAEYERQLANIKDLKTLYEERQMIETRERNELVSKLDDVKKDLQQEQTKTNELEERIGILEADNSKKYDEIKYLESNLGLSEAESKQYRAELAVINQLFSEILLGFNSSKDINLDKLQKHLEEHHDLLRNIVLSEISSEVSYALPKVLLDLLNQVNIQTENEEDGKHSPDEGPQTIIKEEIDSQTSLNHQINSVEEIAENLPKVWRVLIELLSHQKAPMNDLTDDGEDPCYKTVQTPKGPNLVLSVSQTFIRLKDLILEKKALEKETNHLKQLNGHLENRLQDQEKRLELVQTELSRTWHVVGKLQKQHQMLHTQEKILRYELAQKRKLLTELKDELEYSREKWTQAREKNSNTQQQWNQLRTEFVSRKRVINDDLHNSVESGYSDDRECSTDTDEEPGYETDSLKDTKIKFADENISKNTKEYTVLNTETACYFEEDVALNVDTNLSNNKNEADINIESKDDIVRSNENDHVTEIDMENAAQGTHFVESTVPTEQGMDMTVQKEPSTSRNTKSLEELLARKDERLKRLEGQAEELLTRVLDTTCKTSAISNKLDNLHEIYSQPMERAGRDTTELTSNNQEGELEPTSEETLENVGSQDVDVVSNCLSLQTTYDNKNNQE